MLFGKLPAHGDFVCRGMSEEERARWDGWAADGMAAARQALGEDFDAIHSHAPPWCFIVRNAQSWLVGAFAPSADSVGRLFVIVTALKGLSWGEAAARGARLALAQVDILYRALGEGLDADAATALLSALGEGDDGSAAAFETLAVPAGDGVWWTPGGPRHAQAVEQGALPAGLLLRALMPLETIPC